jgi:hypothetical protein
VVGNRRELKREELLRLLLVADAFECLDCVRACTRQLCRAMTYALACKAFTAVPESLKEHAHIRRLLVAAGRALAQGIGVLGGARTWSRRRPDLTRGGKDKVCGREERGERREERGLVSLVDGDATSHALPQFIPPLLH